MRIPMRELVQIAYMRSQVSDQSEQHKITDMQLHEGPHRTLLYLQSKGLKEQGRV